MIKRDKHTTAKQESSVETTQQVANVLFFTSGRLYTVENDTKRVHDTVQNKTNKL